MKQAGASGAVASPAADSTLAIVQLASQADPQQADPEQRARAFAEPLLKGHRLDTGEDAFGHVEGVIEVLRSIGAGPALFAAAYLVYAGDHLQRPEETLRKAFGDSYAGLVVLTRKLVQIQRAVRQAGGGAGPAPRQAEQVRKMLLAFSRDLRVVLLRLASRLQTLRWYARGGLSCPPDLARESLQIFAPLANRLGIWQIKWEIEDLAFRFLQPLEYARMAALVELERAEREDSVQVVREQLASLLARHGLVGAVQGRPKHLYSLWKKMQGKQLAFDQVHDLRALRVLVDDVPACYAVLARVHDVWSPVAGEFDDYIARPKANGYQSLHTVVRADDGQPLEVQIRTRAMHEHAEHGVAAHWLYKEAGARGRRGPGTGGDTEERVAEARKAVMRELLAWEREFARGDAGEAGDGYGDGTAALPGQTKDSPRPSFDDRIYVFTPAATIIDLPVGATPVDFAYSLHTDLGHRCRGARVDGVMVPLGTPLQSGQTVEIIAAKEGGPSLDWLNPDLHTLVSPRAKAKVRAWFNAEQQAQTIARGREAVERLLQREGRTALERDALAAQLGFGSAEALFEGVGKEEFSLRSIELLLRPAEPDTAAGEVLLHPSRSPAAGGRGGVLVVGIDSLLTTLARCCRPAPPDAISGFVTRGRGVAVHRRDCSNLRHMAETAPGRVIEVAWGAPAGNKPAVYPLDVAIEASDRPGLLRDISEIFVKERMNVTGVRSQNTRDGRTAAMVFTVELADATRLGAVLAQIALVPDVRHVRRR